MVKMALFSAWARLQNARAPAGVTVTDRHTEVAVLAVQGPRALQVLETGPLTGNLDEVYAALNRETLLKVSLAPFHI